MHFDWYTKSKILQRLYGRYFWYLESDRATHVIAAYDGETLAGVLLAEIYRDEPKHYSKWKALYVKFVDFVLKVFFRESAGQAKQYIKHLLRKGAEFFSGHF